LSGALPAQILHENPREPLAAARRSLRRLDGGWRYRIDLGPDPASGQRRQVSKQSFRTRKEAEVALRDLTSAIRDGVVPTRDARTLGSLAPQPRRDLDRYRQSDIDEWFATGPTTRKQTLSFLMWAREADAAPASSASRTSSQPRPPACPAPIESR
jgi:hypothetical protein